jgi:hypothetical protein
MRVLSFAHLRFLVGAGVLFSSMLAVSSQLLILVIDFLLLLRRYALEKES